MIKPKLTKLLYRNYELRTVLLKAQVRCLVLHIAIIFNSNIRNINDSNLQFWKSQLYPHGPHKVNSNACTPWVLAWTTHHIYICMLYIWVCVCVCLCTFKFANPTFVHDKHCLTDITVMPTVNWQIVKWQATSALFDCWTSIHFGPKWPATTRQSITARLSDDAHSMPMTVWV